MLYNVEHSLKFHWLLCLYALHPTATHWDLCSAHLCSQFIAQVVKQWPWCSA